MPPLTWSETARQDIVRLYDFLASNYPGSARRARKAIRSGIRSIHDHPALGRPVEDTDDHRDWVVPFGRSAYIVRYAANEEEIVILTIRHGREDGS